MMPLPYGETWQRLAEVVREQLGAVGIDVQLESVDAGTWSSRLSDWDFEMTFNFLYQYGDPALGVARNYISDNIIKGTPFANNGGYENEEVDRLFAEAAVEIDDASARSSIPRCSRSWSRTCPSPGCSSSSSRRSTATTSTIWSRPASASTRPSPTCGSRNSGLWRLRAAAS
jgi:hypothetical protein